MLTGQVKMKKRKEKKLVQTSSACGITPDVINIFHAHVR